MTTGSEDPAPPLDAEELAAGLRRTQRDLALTRKHSRRFARALHARLRAELVAAERARAEAERRAGKAERRAEAAERRVARLRRRARQAERDLAEVRGSTTWRAGRVVVAAATPWRRRRRRSGGGPVVTP